MNFMDQALIARKMPCLEKVRISGENCDPFLLRSWMRAALERDVNEFDVKFPALSVDSNCELTPNFFTHDKLVILKLGAKMTLNFQANSSGFPNLKVLQLDSILYKDYDSLPNLLSSCPILEDLDIVRGREDNLGTFNLISRSVKRLKVNNTTRVLVKKGVAYKMVLDAPVVESLDIRCYKTDEFLVKDLSRTVDAKIEVLKLRPDTFKLLFSVSNTSFLKFYYNDMEPFLRSYDFPVFYNLTRLEISGITLAKNTQWALLLKILSFSPILEHLIYKDYNDHLSTQPGKASDWGVANCLVSSLKTVEFTRCSESDLERVSYFLANAKVLEKMTIRHTEQTSKAVKSNFRNAVFDSRKEGSVTMTWSEAEIVICLH